MRRVLIVTVGTTPEPIIESIEKNEAEIVYLVYGRPLSPNQTPNPFDVTYSAKLKVEKMGRLATPIEISDPEDIDSCVSVFRKLAMDVSEFDEVIVNFTGGTKPMSAAAFYVFLTEMIPSRLTFEYVGGKVRNEYGRVTRMEAKKSYKTASEELSRRVIAHMEECQFYLAKKFSESLPDRVYGFLKKAAEAFWLWDSFEYEKAVRVLNEIGKTAETLEGVAFGQIPENVVKLRNVGNAVVDALRKMRKCQNGKVIDVKRCYLLSLDAIANAERRLKTHNYVEAVLRAYRAIEVATQVKLLNNKINPWNVEWGKIANYRDLLSLLEYKDDESIPKQLTLWSGLRVLDFIESRGIFDKIKDDLQFISQLRNNSKLEHGYSSISRENAENVINKALGIVKTIIGVEDFPEINSLRVFFKTTILSSLVQHR
jgi:CRISPR-associated protein (TIGR02710 family)